MSEGNFSAAQDSLPVISVVLPVYNAGKFLREAIDSILAQTFTSFELIIINDASTDNSEEIILSYHDARIVYHKNEINTGLIATLNKAIDLCRGQFIARMDNDDIALSRRLEQQLDYLRSEDAGLVCSPLIGIETEGSLQFSWPADKHAKTPEQIRRTLRWENCIAHPTVMIRAEIIKKYRYSINQPGSEDWDLWLRLARDKIKLAKTPEPLLRYRLHPGSITQQWKKKEHAQLKTSRVKYRFAVNSIREGRFNFFVLKTFLTIAWDLGYHFKKTLMPAYLDSLKWGIKINPFLALKEYSRLKAAIQHDTGIFLFFPYSHIGGAEKVHAQITRVAEQKEPLVFFTGLSNGKPHLAPFGDKALLLAISRALYHPLFAARSEQMITNRINRTNGAIVLGCNSLFFYKIISRLHSSVYVADLTHDFDYEKNRSQAELHIPDYLRLNERIFISNSTLQRTIAFYKTHSLGEVETKKFRLVYNYVEEVQMPAVKSTHPPFRALYAGRDTAEKRVHLVFELAELCEREELPVEFVMAGEIENRAPSLKNISLLGPLFESALLAKEYARAHFVLISSSSEGFPLSLMEGMANGCIPLATAVGDIPFHIQHGFNGYTVDPAGNVAEDMKTILQAIIAGGVFPGGVSANAMEYSRRVFNRGQFMDAYRRLFRIS